MGPQVAPASVFVQPPEPLHEEEPAALHTIPTGLSPSPPPLEGAHAASEDEWAAFFGDWAEQLAALANARLASNATVT